MSNPEVTRDQGRGVIGLSRQPKNTRGPLGNQDSFEPFFQGIFRWFKETVIGDVEYGYLEKVATGQIQVQSHYGRILSDKQVGELSAGVYESTRGAIPLADIVATIATLPFGGGLGVGTKLATRLGLLGVTKVVFAHFVDSLGKEMLSVSVDILAGKKINYRERAKKVAAGLAVSALGVGLKNKLAPFLEKKFIALAKQNQASINTAQNAVDAKIVDQWVASVLDEAMKFVVKK